MELCFYNKVSIDANFDANAQRQKEQNNKKE